MFFVRGGELSVGASWALAETGRRAKTQTQARPRDLVPRPRAPLPPLPSYRSLLRLSLARARSTADLDDRQSRPLDLATSKEYTRPLPLCVSFRRLPLPFRPSFVQLLWLYAFDSPPPSLVSHHTMLRVATLLSAAALLSADAVRAAAVSHSAFPNSACAGAASGALGGLVGIGKVTLSNGDVEAHCGCVSVRPPSSVPDASVC